MHQKDIIFKVSAGGSFSKSLKTWFALPVRLSPRDLVLGGISWASLWETPENLIRLARQVFSLTALLGVGFRLFRNPWKPDSPCPSGFLPYGLFRARVSCVGSRQKSVTLCIVSPSICHEVIGLDAMILVFFNEFLSQFFHSPLSPSSRGFLVPVHSLSAIWSC